MVSLTEKYLDPFCAKVKFNILFLSIGTNCSTALGGAQVSARSQFSEDYSSHDPQEELDLSFDSDALWEKEEI